jgi:hypothetical protein
MRYADIEIESLLKLARAAREMERNAISARFDASAVIGSIAATFGELRAPALIEIILSQEDRLSDFREHWKGWRRRRARPGRRRV